MKISQIKQSIPHLFDIGMSPLLVGHAGVGKTQVIKQIAKEKGLKYFPIYAGQMSDAGDLLGLPDFEENEEGVKIGTKFIPFNKLPTEENCLIHFDELNRANKDIIQCLFQIILDGEISLNGWKKPKNCHVIASCNPDTSDYVVNAFNDNAFIDRFCHIKFEPSIDEWASYARGNKFSPLVVEFALEHPQMCFDGLTNSGEFSLGELRPTFRSLEFLSKLDKLNLPQELMYELTVGIIGSERATQFRAKKAEVVTITSEDIFNDVKKTDKFIKKYPDRTDAIDNALAGCVDLIYKEDKDLDSLQNLLNFCKKVNKDLAYKHMHQIFMSEVNFEAKKVDSNLDKPSLTQTNCELIYRLLNEDETRVWAMELLKPMFQISEEESA